MLALYRARLAHPGARHQHRRPSTTIQDQFGGSNILGFLNLFSGGGLSRIAIFALGIMPYITASIILQLLTVVVPSLEKLPKEGEVGQAAHHAVHALPHRRPRLRPVDRLRLPLPLVPGQRRARRSSTSFDAPHVFLIVISLTAGTVLLMWMGELITQRGIGNGISLMIFASIVAGLPNGIQAWWTNPDQVFKVMMPFIALAVIAAIVFVQEGQRRIPVQYAKRVIGRRMTGGGQTYLPLRVNMAGVIPVIFAASIMAFPPTIGQLINTPWRAGPRELLQPQRLGLRRRRVDPDHPLHLLLHGGHVQPRRPGRQPQEVRRLHPRGETGPADGRVPRPHPRPADVPRRALPGRWSRRCRRSSSTRPSANFFFGGTSLLIVVGVALDTMKQLEAQLMMRNYEGFLK